MSRPAQGVQGQVPPTVRPPLGGAAARGGDGHDRRARDRDPARRPGRRRRERGDAGEPDAGDRQPRRRDARQRRELPDQEAADARSASSRSRTRPAYDTAPPSPVWGRRSDEAGRRPSSRTWANSDCIVIMGSNMAEGHPVGFQWVMEAQRARRAASSTSTPASPARARWRRSTSASAPARDIAFLGGRRQLHPRERALVPRVRRQLHERAGDPRRGLPGHRGPRRLLLGLGPGDGQVRHRRPGSTRA